MRKLILAGLALLSFLLVSRPASAQAPWPHVTDLAWHTSTVAGACPAMSLTSGYSMPASKYCGTLTWDWTTVGSGIKGGVTYSMVWTAYKYNASTTVWDVSSYGQSDTTAAANSSGSIACNFTFTGTPAAGSYIIVAYVCEVDIHGNWAVLAGPIEQQFGVPSASYVTPNPTPPSNPIFPPSTMESGPIGPGGP